VSGFSTFASDTPAAVQKFCVIWALSDFVLKTQKRIPFKVTKKLCKFDHQIPYNSKTWSSATFEEKNDPQKCKLYIQFYQQHYISV